MLISGDVVHERSKPNFPLTRYSRPHWTYLECDPQAASAAWYLLLTTAAQIQLLDLPYNSMLGHNPHDVVFAGHVTRA